MTGNIYLASVFTLLVAGIYWRRATTAGAYAALVLGAIGPITFLVVNLFVPGEKQISAAAAGAASFGLAFAGMGFVSLLTRPARSNVPEVPP